MKRLDHRSFWLAVVLSAQAGYVDALGFIELGGFFVSFMSGNSTRLAVGVVGEGSDAIVAATLIVAFVAGAFAATLLLGFANARWKRALVLALLTLCLVLSAMWHSFSATHMALLGLAFAMGVENLVFERDGEIAVGLTYMTGALVKLGQRMAYAVTGAGDKRDWLPLLGLWGALMTGAVAGALAHPVLGLNAIWLAVVVSSGAALSEIGTNRS